MEYLSWLCMVPLDKLVTVSCGNMNGARSTPLERLLHCHCTGTVLDMEAVEDIDDACWLTITVGNTSPFERWLVFGSDCGVAWVLVVCTSLLCLVVIVTLS